MSRPGMLTAIVVMIVAFLCPSAAIGHDVPQRQVLNAFVKVDDGSLQLVVRGPLDLLASAQFPVKGREIDLASREADAAVRRALAAIANDMAVWEYDGQLVASSAKGRLSLPSDRSFERYEDAVAHVQAPVPADTVIYHGQGFLDPQLTYPVRSSASRFSIRTRLAPQLRDHVKLALRFIGADGNSSTLVLSTISGRVALGGRRRRGSCNWGCTTSWAASTTAVPAVPRHSAAGRDRSWPSSPRHDRPFVTLIGSVTASRRRRMVPPFVETGAVDCLHGAGEHRPPTSRIAHGSWASSARPRVLPTLGLGTCWSRAVLHRLELGIAVLACCCGPGSGPAPRRARAHGVIVMSALVANVGWDWMTERAEVLWQVGWPQPDRQGVATLLLWVAGIVLAATAARYLASRARGLRRPQPFVRDQAAAEPKA